MSGISSNNKQIAKNTLFLYLRMFLTMAVSLYTVRVVVQTLSLQDYGLYGAVGGVVLSFGFLSGVLSNASQRFFSVELGKGESGKLKETFSTVFFTYLALTLIIVLLAETIGLWFLLNKMTIPEGREQAAMWVYQFALLSFIVTIIANPFQALIIAYEKMNLYAYLSILDVIFKLFIVYILILFDTDKLKLYAVLMFVVSLLTNSVYIIYCCRKYNSVRIVLRPDKEMLTSIFSYSSWTLFGTLSGMCNTQGMNIVLNIFFGPIANAAYSISFQIYNTVAMFANNFYVAVKPALIKNYTAGNYEYVNKLFHFSSKSIFLLLYIIILPIIICTYEILNIWLGEVGEYMVSFVRLSLIYTLILIISYPITAVVQASGSVKMYHGLVDGFSLLALPLMYIFFRLGYDASYAYLVSIIIFTLAHIIRLYVLKRVFKTFSIKGYIVHFIIPSALVALLSYIFMAIVGVIIPNGFIWVIVKCLLSCMLVLILGAFIVLSKSDRSMILNLIRKS